MSILYPHVGNSYRFLGVEILTIRGVSNGQVIFEGKPPVWYTWVPEHWTPVDPFIEMIMDLQREEKEKQ